MPPNLLDRDLIFRASRRLRTASLKLLGERMEGVVSLGVGNAREVAGRYSAVTCDTLVERGPDTTRIPLHLPEDELPSTQPFRDECESVLLDIRNPGFSFRSHLLIDDRRHAIYSETFSDVLVFREYAPKRLRKLTGTCAYLSNTWIDNYYHWMQLTLPMLRLYRQLRPDVPIDYYYVGATRLLDVQYECLAKLGIRREQVVTEACRADRLLAAFYLHRAQHCGLRYRDSRGHQFVRELFQDELGIPSREPARKIYVGRSTARTRRLLNEEELIRFLEARGFQSVRMDGRSVAEQARLFHDAEVIVGVHGAALTNILFSKVGTRLVEILPHGFEETSFFAAASHGGLEHAVIVGEPLNPETQRSQIANQDLLLDMNKFQRLYEAAGL